MHLQLILGALHIPQVNPTKNNSLHTQNLKKRW